MPMSEVVGGRNNVMAALKGRRSLNKILVGNYVRGQLSGILSLAKSRDCPVQFVPRKRLDQVAGHVNHQGVVALAAPWRYWQLDQLLEKLTPEGNPLVVMLAGVEDPHNLGALLRTCACAGVAAIVIPKRRSAQLSDTVARVSMGGIEETPVCRVANLAASLAALQKAGFWAAAADNCQGEIYYQIKWDFPCVLILGSEGRGVPRLLLERSDYRVKIPMLGKISSLNVSVAGGVLLFEILRQRAEQGHGLPGS